MIGARFTAWLSEKEKAELIKRARKERTSKNMIVRMAIRTYLGMEDEPLEDNELPVTSDTAKGIPT